jgi:hypothetical protein
MKLKGRSVPAIDTFTTSRMYNSFLKFTMYSQKLNITSSVFIKLMVDLDIESVIWCRDNTYSIYLEHYDKFHDPGEQVVNTLEFLKVLAEKENVVINQIFNHLGFMRFLEYVRLRKISPWVIFNSTSCTNFFKNLDQEDLGVLSGILNFKVWADRLGKNKDDCLLLQELIGEYGL